MLIFEFIANSSSVKIKYFTAKNNIKIDKKRINHFHVTMNTLECH